MSWYQHKGTPQRQGNFAFWTVQSAYRCIRFESSHRSQWNKQHLECCNICRSGLLPMCALEQDTEQDNSTNHGDHGTRAIMEIQKRGNAFLPNGSCPTLSQYLGSYETLQIYQLRSFKPIRQAKVYGQTNSHFHVVSVWLWSRLVHLVSTFTILSQFPAEGSGKNYIGECIFYSFPASTIQPWEQGWILGGGGIVRIERKGIRDSEHS